MKVLFAVVTDDENEESTADETIKPETKIVDVFQNHIEWQSEEKLSNVFVAEDIIVSNYDIRNHRHRHKLNIARNESSESLYNMKIWETVLLKISAEIATKYPRHHTTIMKHDVYNTKTLSMKNCFTLNMA